MKAMTEQAGHGKRNRRRWRTGLAVFAFLVSVALVPHLIGLNRYKTGITRLMSESVGRPVRLASIQLRVLPTPGFVLNDLTIEEDPAYGAEPVLHAGSVVASIRLSALWRGRLEIGRISVDEASLNLVRTPEGLWNLDPLFRTAARRSRSSEGGAGRPVPLPYLEATNSRINMMRGSEKLPFSLVDTDLSFWQQSVGDWRVRLKGEPVRTDRSMELAGSGDAGLVRLEASLRRAPELRQMPLHVDLEWSDAQAGELTRLALGSDAGWRGSINGELNLDGTLDAASIDMRMRAAGVHRAEFAPADPMDFDARCSLLFHFTQQSVENLACDSPLGSGRIRISGGLASEGQPPALSVELVKVPADAVLNAMRTVRSGIGPSLQAAGTIDGKLIYAPGAAREPAGQSSAEKARAGGETLKARGRAAPARAEPGPLTGSLIVDGLQLSGNGIGAPIQLPRIAVVPAPASQDGTAVLSASVSFPLGGASPVNLAATAGISGYKVELRGPASLARVRQVAAVAGLAQVSLLDSIGGEPVAFDLSAEGRWIAAEEDAGVQSGAELERAAYESGLAGLITRPGDTPAIPVSDKVTGTVTLRNANWKAAYLSRAVAISQATLLIQDGSFRWDPIAFAYGPVKGTATLAPDFGCGGECTPRFTLDFELLDASALQDALLGAREKGTMLSEWIARLSRPKPAGASAWPRAEGTARAETLRMGPLTLRDAAARLRMTDEGVEIEDFSAACLGGSVKGSGSIRPPGGEHGSPQYTFEAKFEKLNPKLAGELAGAHWKGGELDAEGKVELSGFSGADLASSARGSFSFAWKDGGESPEGGSGAPPALARFDRWTGEAEISHGAISLKQSAVERNGHKTPVAGTVSLGSEPALSLALKKQTQPKRR